MTNAMIFHITRHGGSLMYAAGATSPNITYAVQSQAGLQQKLSSLPNLGIIYSAGDINPMGYSEVIMKVIMRF